MIKHYVPIHFSSFSHPFRLFGNEDVDLRQLPIGGTLLMGDDARDVDFPKVRTPVG